MGIYDDGIGQHVLEFFKKCYNITRCFQNRSSIEKDKLLNSTIAYIDKNISCQ